MKKTITLLVCLFAGLAVQAQSDFPLQFIDQDGQVIPDGTWLDITDYEEDEFFGDILMPVKVWVKNVSGSAVYGGASYTIQNISNGWFQTCFPSVCMRQNAKGSYATQTDNFIPGVPRDIQTEWMPDREGVCFVTYQLKTFRKMGTNYMPDGDGPMITLNFYYGDVTGISGKSASSKPVSSVTYYDLSGQITERPRHGVFIKRTTYTDGTSDVRKKILY